MARRKHDAYRFRGPRTKPTGSPANRFGRLFKPDPVHDPRIGEPGTLHPRQKLNWLV